MKSTPGETSLAAWVSSCKLNDFKAWTYTLRTFFTGLKGEKATFINLAALAGPVGGKLESMMDVNYKAPVAAAKACQQLGFGHWVQSSTQATNSERAGQVHF